MKFSDYSKGQQAGLVIGASVVVLGLLMFFARYSSWWMGLLDLLRTVLRYLLPIGIILIGAIVVYGLVTHRFDGLLSRVSAVGGPLTRSASDKRLAGVCGGIAQYFGIDSTIVRAITVGLGVLSPLLTLIAYVALSIALPLK